MNDIRIAFSREKIGVGGIETVIIDTANILADYGFHFYIISNKYDGNKTLEKSPNITVITLPDYMEYETVANKEILISTLKNNKIDLVCFDDFNEEMVNLISQKTDCKLFYWMHSAPLYHEKQRRVRDYYRIRGNTYYRIFRYYPFRLALKIFPIRDRIKQAKLCKKAISMSDFVAVLVPKYALELKQKLKLTDKDVRKIITLTNTIDINNSVNLKKSKKIVFIGRLDDFSKRADRLVKIWERIEKDLPEWTLEMYGDGCEKDNINKYIINHNINRCFLHGYTNNVQSVYDEASVVCLTSEYEGLPMTLLEAQNNGCIPMAFDCVDGISFVIGKDKEYGRIVKSYDLGEYAQKLKELCLDEQLRLDIQARILEKRIEYNHNKIIPTWLNIKQNIVE